MHKNEEINKITRINGTFFMSLSTFLTYNADGVGDVINCM